MRRPRGSPAKIKLRAPLPKDGPVLEPHQLPLLAVHLRLRERTAEVLRTGQPGTEEAEKKEWEPAGWKHGRKLQQDAPKDNLPPSG